MNGVKRGGWQDRRDARRSIVSEYRERWGWRCRSGLLLAVFVSASLFGLGSLRPASGEPATKGSSGSIALSGEVVAKLEVPAFLQPGNQPGCSISPSQGGTDVIVWDNAKIKEAGKTVTVPNMNLQLEVAKFGRKYSMTVPKTSSAVGGAAYLTTADPYQWASTSGTITTSAGGKSGSIDGVLTDGSHHPGKITIKGSWAGCRSLG
jgi:hypothetical protein